MECTWFRPRAESIVEKWICSRMLGKSLHILITIFSETSAIGRSVCVKMSFFRLQSNEFTQCCWWWCCFFSAPMWHLLSLDSANIYRLCRLCYQTSYIHRTRVSCSASFSSSSSPSSTSLLSFIHLYSWDVCWRVRVCECDCEWFSLVFSQCSPYLCLALEFMTTTTQKRMRKKKKKQKVTNHIHTDDGFVYTQTIASFLSFSC